MYKIEKILGYQPSQMSSALPFGGAIDDALNDIVQGGDINKAKGEFKKKVKKLFKTTDYYFFKGDFDYDILTDKQVEIAEDYLKELEYDGNMDIPSLHKALYKKILENGNDYNVITEKQQLFLSCISAMSLKQKGLMMIDAYIENIMPEIEEVISVQRETKERPGFVDLEVKLKGIGKVTADNKTASRLYDQAKVDYSPQLMLYDLETKHGQVAYFVLGKNVKKNKTQECTKCGMNGNGLRHKTCPNEIDGVRCNGAWDVFITPEIETQILIADVDKDKQKSVLESVKSVEDAIDKGAFPMNLEACANQFGKPCPYIHYCHKGSTKNMKKR